jgi:AraC-like DNA-binding protein
VNTRLRHIQNWGQLAKDLNWSASALAKHCGISVRTLQRHFLKTAGKTPKAWLTECRLQRAEELLRSGLTIKETASQLGYKHAHHFSREFKEYWGYCPGTLPTYVAKPDDCRISV